MIYQCAVTPILEDIVAEGERVLGLASGDGIAVRLLGGVVVRLQAPTLPPAFDREYKDLDFAAPKGGSSAADRLLRGAGYEPHTALQRVADRALQGARHTADHVLGDRLRDHPRVQPLPLVQGRRLRGQQRLVAEVHGRDVPARDPHLRGLAAAAPFAGHGPEDGLRRDPGRVAAAIGGRFGSRPARGPGPRPVRPLRCRAMAIYEPITVELRVRLLHP